MENLFFVHFKNGEKVIFMESKLMAILNNEILIEAIDFVEPF